MQAGDKQEDGEKVYESVRHVYGKPIKKDLKTARRDVRIEWLLRTAMDYLRIRKVSR